MIDKLTKKKHPKIKRMTHIFCKILCKKHRREKTITAIQNNHNITKQIVRMKKKKTKNQHSHQND